ncbi:hypothetical protein [Actinomyces minihominis]|uniref:hypothetical protein n=1 Tax=Actinomyces minihominis TaxID=2002838 RepID=UPI00101AE435|nr:hypothetical protein [Actinomyces minihominis]
MRSLRSSIAAALAVGVLGLTACSTGGGAQSGNAGNTDEAVGPLDEYLSVLWSGEDWSEEQAQEKQRQIEELIAQCMADEGFEYIPNTTSLIQPRFEDGSTEEIPWDSLEFAEKYGYGIIDWPGRDEVYIPDEEGPAWVDPNQEYVESLSESERQAYFETLYGAETSNEILDSSMAYEPSTYNWQDHGCAGWADYEVNGDQVEFNVWDDPQFEDLMDSIGQLWDDIYNSPDMAAIETEWAACMSEAGYPGFAAKDDAMTQMFDLQNELYADSSVGEEWVEPSQAAKDEFQEKEIALAVADWKCTDKIQYAKKRLDVDHNAQQAFLDAHRAELDAMVAKANEMKSN